MPVADQQEARRMTDPTSPKQVQRQAEEMKRYDEAMAGLDEAQNRT